LSFRSVMRAMFLGPTLERDESDFPLASESAWQAQISAHWGQLSGVGFSPNLIDRVWVANTCIDFTASQIASMPLRHYGKSRDPAWVANPDPEWYPNGIGDAVYAGIDSYLRWGDAFLVITNRYSDGYPSGWTLADASTVTVDVRRGRRFYRIGELEFDKRDVVQISRDPRAGAQRGTSVIKSYASQAYGLLAASDLGRMMMQSDVPQFALKPTRKVTPEQAQKMQGDWVGRAAERRGAPWVLPPDLEIEKLSFSVADLMLLDAQKFNAQILAASCGVPAQFLNLPIEGGLNYQSPAMLGEHWWRFKLRTFAKAFSRALSGQMLPAGSAVEFDASETMAPAYESLVEAVAKLVETGVVTTQEARALLRLPVEEAADALADLLTPPSAGASPAQQQSSTVVALRPTGSTS
jgi:HK97 family phage portal protein